MFLVCREAAGSEPAARVTGGMLFRGWVCSLVKSHISIVAILTVLFCLPLAEQKIIAFRFLCKNESSRTSTRETGFGANSYPTAAAYGKSIAELLSVVNSTHRDGFSKNRLNCLSKMG